MVAFRAILYSLGLLTTATAQQAAAPQPPSDARARLEKALAGVDERSTLAIELCWQESSGSLVQFQPAEPAAMPALDMDLRTRLRIRPAPPK